MYVTCTVCAVSNLPLRLFNCFCNVHCYSTSFRVWHQVTRTKDTSKATYKCHHVRCSDYYVKVQPAVIDFCNKIIFTNKVCTSSFCFFCFCTACEHKHTLSFTSSVWKNHCTTDLLIRFFYINVQVISNFYSCVKFCKVCFFCKCYSFFYTVCFCAVDFFKSSTKLFAFFSHFLFSL
ncbi:hypothetical protein SCODD09_00936 [Streptococcus constellatus]|nr:hypothetical protein SCODD09_00936 [Streptococcus constellatus]